MYNRENLLKTSGEKNATNSSRSSSRYIPKVGSGKRNEKSYYISPFPRRCKKWIKYQTELFKKHNPINACDIEGKITFYNTRCYFNQQNLTSFGGAPFLISFIEKMGIEEDLEDVFDHQGYIYSTTDLILSAITGITVGVDRLYHLNAIR